MNSAVANGDENLIRIKFAWPSDHARYSDAAAALAQLSTGPG